MSQFPLPPPPKSAIPQPPLPPTKPRPSGGFIAAVVIIGLVIVGGAINAVDGGESNGGDGSPIGDTHSVRYLVAGSSRQADVTYQNANADTSQESGVVVPWSYSLSAESGAFLYISAQRGGAAGDITCAIEVDGRTVETNTSQGPYTICTASASL